MFDEEDRAYFAQRAAYCREKANLAIDPAMKRIHSELANEYERRSVGEAPKAGRRLR